MAAQAVEGQAVEGDLHQKVAADRQTPMEEDDDDDDTGLLAPPAAKSASIDPLSGEEEADMKTFMSEPIVDATATIADESEDICHTLSVQNVESSLSSPGAVATHSFAAFPAQPVPGFDISFFPFPLLAHPLAHHHPCPTRHA